MSLASHSHSNEGQKSCCSGNQCTGEETGHSKVRRTSSSKSSTVKQIFALLVEKKAWWLIPMVTVFLLLGLLIVLTQGSALSPFIYALF